MQTIVDVKLPRYVETIHRMSEPGVTPRRVTKARAAAMMARAVNAGEACTVWPVISDGWPGRYQVGTVGASTLLWWEVD